MIQLNTKEISESILLFDTFHSAKNKKQKFQQRSLLILNSEKILQKRSDTVFHKLLAYLKYLYCTVDMTKTLQVQYGW